MIATPLLYKQQMVEVNSPRTYHLIYGKDADLILLSLLCKTRNTKTGKDDYVDMIVMREDVSSYVYIKELRDSLTNICGSIDDFVVMLSLIGNDFVCKIPSFAYMGDSLNALVNALISVREKAGVGRGAGFISSKDGKDISKPEWILFLQKLVEGEVEITTNSEGKKIETVIVESEVRMLDAIARSTMEIPVSDHNDFQALVYRAIDDKYKAVLIPGGPQVKGEQYLGLSYGGYGSIGGILKDPIKKDDRKRRITAPISESSARIQFDTFRKLWYERAISMFRKEQMLRLHGTNVSSLMQQGATNDQAEAIVLEGEKKFLEAPITPDDVQRMCAEYITSIRWCQRYYSVGDASSTYVYPYRFAPMLVDLLPAMKSYGMDTNTHLVSTVSDYNAVHQIISVIPPSLFPKMIFDVVAQTPAVQILMPSDYHIYREDVTSTHNTVVDIPHVDLKLVYDALPQIRVVTGSIWERKPTMISRSIQKLWINKLVLLREREGRDRAIPTFLRTSKRYGTQQRGRGRGRGRGGRSIVGGPVSQVPFSLESGLKEPSQRTYVGPPTTYDRTSFSDEFKQDTRGGSGYRGGRGGYRGGRGRGGYQRGGRGYGGSYQRGGGRGSGRRGGEVPGVNVQTNILQQKEKPMGEISDTVRRALLGIGD